MGVFSSDRAGKPATRLEFVELSCRYGEVTALDGLTFAVPPGQMFGFLGPNGAGKTTAMRAVFGLVSLDAGEVRWRGAPVGERDRLRFGYMPEERGLYAGMRVLDQLVFIGRLHGLQAGSALEAARHWTERLGIADRREDKLESLSLGNQQRIQLAAALIHAPDLLVLDEPFSGLDPVAVDTMSEVLSERAAAGATVLFSSHQLDLVEHVCEAVAIVDRGRLLIEGPVASSLARVRPAPGARGGRSGRRMGPKRAPRRSRYCRGSRCPPTAVGGVSRGGRNGQAVPRGPTTGPAGRSGEPLSADWWKPPGWSPGARSPSTFERGRSG